MATKRSMVFVDEQNLTNGAADYYGKPKQLDFIELLAVLTEDTDLIRPYLFTSYSGEKPQRFYHVLRKERGYRVIAKPRRKRGGTYIEKGVDIEIATELIVHGLQGSYDVGILVSGDADFCRAVRIVQDHGILVNGAMFENRTSNELKETVDRYTKLDDHAGVLRQ